VTASSSIKDDDHNALEPENSSELWDAEINRLFDDCQIPRPDEAGEFDAEINFEMSIVESRYLRQRFLEAETGSIVSNVFRNRTFHPADYPWQWDHPESLSAEVDHAQCFSMLTKIATLLYYRLLDTKRTANGFEGCGVDLTQAIADWWQQCRQKMLEWDIEKFVRWIEIQKIARGSDRNFISTLHKKIRELSTSDHLIAETVDLIVVREKDKRPNKRRLVPGRFQNEWKLPTQRPGFFTDPKHLPYLLDFRSGIASQIIGDIWEGLKRR